MKNFIVKFIFTSSVILLCALFYYACDDSGSVTPPSNLQFSITGKIADWSGGGRLLVSLINGHASSSFVLSYCSIDTSGNFNLALPTPPDTCLYTADSVFTAECISGNPIFNPADAKATQVHILEITYNSNPTGYIECNTYPIGDSAQAGDYHLMYVYFDKAVSMSGTRVCLNDTLTFSGSAVAGWNKIVKHYQSVSSSGKRILYDMNDPGTAIWRYHSN